MISDAKCDHAQRHEPLSPVSEDPDDQAHAAQDDDRQAGQIDQMSVVFDHRLEYPSRAFVSDNASCPMLSRGNCVEARAMRCRRSGFRSSVAGSPPLDHSVHDPELVADPADDEIDQVVEAAGDGDTSRAWPAERLRRRGWPGACFPDGSGESGVSRGTRISLRRSLR